MKVCYFGIYKPNYSRNKILISGLERNDVKVIQCVSNKAGFIKYFDLIKKYWKIRNSFDVMVVGYPGFQAVLLAKCLTRKPIAFDAFVSLYDSMVQDRKEVPSGSLKAMYYWFLDKISMTLADLVLFDTEEHKNFVSAQFGIPSAKVKRIFLGSDTSVFFPQESLEKREVFKVIFYGHYIPLQGIEYIIRAAKLLEDESDIMFEIIGGGKGKKEMIALADSFDLTNTVFIDEMPITELARAIAESDVSLGVFGDTEKTGRVIPNKVFDGVSMKKPVITADTPAIRELFNDSNMFLVDTANANSIADAILLAKADYPHALLRAESAYKIFTLQTSSKVLGHELKNFLRKLYV
jgi:glycosyltransferase involved in cell wall biosynthesis